MDLNLSYLSDSDSELSGHLSFFDVEGPDSSDSGKTAISSATKDSISLSHSTKKHKITYSCLSTPSDFNVFAGQPSPKRARIERNLTVFETLPIEIIQKIAANVDRDSKLLLLSLASSSFAEKILPENSAVWRIRFLDLYDPPKITNSYGYCHAYRIRQFVLRNFEEFGGNHEKNLIQLEVLKEMALEAYSESTSGVRSICSKNMNAFESSSNSSWMIHFLATPFYPSSEQPGCFGSESDIFDALQLLFSYLRLSPSYPVAQTVNIERAHYDIQRVYNWHKPFNIIYNQHDGDQDPPGRENRQPPVKRRPSDGTTFRFTLDLHTLLHIKNFWQRHLVDNNSSSHGDLVENTYSIMMNHLARINPRKTPRRWTHPLAQHLPMHTTWFGHYSCLHPWPKKREELEEQQTCCADWDQVDPLKLEFVTNDVTEGQYWPPIFSTVPIFSETAHASTSDSISSNSNGHICIRGFAPFVDLRLDRPKSTNSSYNSPSSKTRKKSNVRPRETNPSSSPNANNSQTETSSSSGNVKYHPYLSLRLRGLIHPVPDQEGIPNWRRIIMILYRPTTRYLIQVLEHAAEDYGDPFMQALPGLVGAQQANTNSAATPVNIADFTPEEIEKAQRQVLDKKIAEWTDHRLLQSRPSLINPKHDNTAGSENDPLLSIWSPSYIAELEDSFIAPAALEWTDIDYAYAYEGVIVPGGTVMLGRYWRIASPAGGGEGKGLEVGDRERGPWVFWS